VSIQDLGAIGEFVGSIGVIVTLVYLAIQIRANTRAIKASPGFDATHSWANLKPGLWDQRSSIGKGAISVDEADFPSGHSSFAYVKEALMVVGRLSRG
jgi:hypothetical protein